ncbi:MAG: PorP/SprF family type IX secretion system membrane protein [Ferruginibacter sp.]|nr:PorP/SprF family type IX secretion system membrane protein [Ferruginibacter sp.]
MKKNTKILLLVLFSLHTLPGLHAQDLHFSQFFNSPLTTNPANTGFIPDADYRIGAHYRNQYSSILSSPYKTISIFGDAQLLRNQIENGWLGLGGLILSDIAGSGGLRSTKIYGSLAYHQQLGNSSLLSAGFNVGWANKRIDVSKLSFPDQFDGKFFDNSLPSSVVLNTNSVSYLDIQAGLNYAYFPSEDIYINGGYSIHHVNGPQETFFSSSADSSKIPMRHIGFLNALLKVNDRVIINPNIYYTNQARSSEFVLGLNANYNLSGEGGETQLIAGVYYRAGDAIIPMVGFEIKNIRFTFSYDATTSALRNFNNFQGANEFNIIKKGFYNENNGDTRQVFCPKF